MNALAHSFADEDFAILAFPCNQFGQQEPGANASEISNGIRHVRPGGGFEPMVTLFEKTEVNGQDEDEIFTFLKGGCSFTDTVYRSRLYYEPKRVGDIHWNFEKFLVGREGRPRARFHPTVTDPEALVDDIANLLHEKPSGGPSNRERTPRATTVSL